MFLFCVSAIIILILFGSFQHELPVNGHSTVSQLDVGPDFD